MGTYIDEFEEWIFGGKLSENRTVADLIVLGEIAEVEINCRMWAIKRRGKAPHLWSKVSLNIIDFAGTW